MKIKAFTMAEVLITLGMIGIVAAMTLPSLMNYHRNKALETGFKRSYSLLSQALEMYQAQTGERLIPEHFKVMANGKRLRDFMSEYFNVMYDCGLNNVCFASDIYKTFNGKVMFNYTYFDDGQFILNDGSVLFFEQPVATSTRIYLSFDVNGYLKNPNRVGWDVFVFQVDSRGVLLPMGAPGTDFYSETNEYCSSSSSDWMNGIGCAYNALTDKFYFKNLH